MTITNGTTGRLGRSGARLRGDGVSVVPYLMAGHTGLDTTRELGKRLVNAGVGALELGIPHNDPLADGPVIQRAAQRAVDAGVTLAGCLEVARDVADEGAAPVVLMTYVNPVLAYGVERFARDAAECGVSGVIAPDLPVEEAAATGSVLRAHGVDLVMLVAPTSSPERVAAACAASSGFVYCVTVTGITGTRTDLPAGVRSVLSTVRANTALPVAAGFGISRPDHIRDLAGHADAAVVGSALVDLVDRGQDPTPLVKELVTACD
ncbi:tryptophan synthase subunit alpha [Actinokineospora pegani]|uniref:tryptophan synthase subunit alpha n=1 Tax=Actinokineospora pegani TaxID=2654637 RepID=UPI0012EAE8A5|nr:tryptophan synthase subunit alpha [Actinokineospora pegani]